MSPNASLIVPTYQRQALVVKLLEQVGAQSSQDFEILVVDQSDQPSTDLLNAAKSNPRLRYLHCDHPSLPNARNIGAREAKGEILIFIDDDVTLDEGFVAAHIAAYQDNGPIAIAGRITGGYDQSASQPAPKSVGRLSPWTATVSRNFHGTSPVQNIDQLPGGNFSIKREAYLRINGFDLNAFGGRASIGEESDFAARLRKHGGRIDFCPDALLHHDHADEGGCRETQQSEWTFWHGHNFATLARRNLSPLAWAVFWGVFLLRYLAHGAKALNPMVTIAGWRGLLCGFFTTKPAPQELVALGNTQELA